MNRTLTLVAGVLFVLIGMALVMPAVAQMRDTGTLPTLGVALLLLGLTLTLSGGGAVVYGARRMRA
ncbi:MAG: hypothetical protein H0T51_05945 [Pirellulales bacterium]|nr:hypothetical protein [Pirellulales bacterium]